ncbi:MAG: GON domain-containing protein [Kofleriaceae bacterium]
MGLLILVSACSFSPSAAVPDDDGDDDDVIDAAPPITCGDLVCDPNATCAAAGPSCSCNAGYTGDGMTCADLDECATNNGGCEAQCANTPGSHECYAPASCAEIKTRFPAAVDGPFTLYLGGDAGKPWTAFCANMARTPAEYLSLTEANFSQYTSGGASPGASVRTTFTKVRFRPATLAIVIADKRFATSTGGLDHSGDTEVTSMPYGVAMDCRNAGSSAGVATLDLRGTKFTFAASSFAQGGNNAASTRNSSSGDQIVTLTGGGFCGWIAPTGTPFDPFNNNADGATLIVSYDD